MVVTKAELDQVFSEKYLYFENYIKKVSGNNYNRFEQNPTDILNDVYIEVSNRVDASGITGTTLVSYIKQSLRNNLYYQVRPDLKKNKIKKINYCDVTQQIEEIFLYKEELEKQHKIYDEESMYISKKIFQYIEGRYDQQSKYIFKCYFLMERRMTYKKLSKQTGYSIKDCCNTIKKIKKDLNENFNDWLISNP